MATFAGALARGLAGYADGRREREEDDYRRAQIEQQRLRQEKLDEQNRQRQELLMQQITQSMQMQQAQEADRVGRAQRDLSENGYRLVGDQAEEYLNAIGLDPASMPTTTLGGQQYRKSGQSTQYMAGLQDERARAAAQREQQAKDAQQLEQIRKVLPAAVRPLAIDLKTAQALAEKVGTQRVTPRAPRAPLTEQGADGAIYYSEDGGRNWRRGRVEGFEQGNPSADASEAASGPPAAALTPEMPGAGFSSGYQPPRRGPFGNAKANEPASPDEIKAAGFAQRMEQSSQIMNEFGGSSPVRDPLARAAGALPFVGESFSNSLTDPARQKYWNAAQNWVRANLRKESGAAISEEEMAGEISTYFPMAGDDAQTIEQKRQLRETTEAAMRQMAGKAYRPFVRKASTTAGDGGLSALETLFSGGRR